MRKLPVCVLGAAAAVALSVGVAAAAPLSYFKMNETAGVLADSIGGVNMTPQNAAGFTYGAASVPAATYGAITLTPAQATSFGTAVTSSGTSIFNNTTSNNALNTLPAPLTVMAWVKPNVTTITQRILSGSGGDGNGWGYGLIAGGNQRFTTYGVTDYNQAAGTTAVAGAWQHVAVSFTGTTANFYVNGNLVDTKTGSNFGANTSEVYALFGQANATESFAGTVDEVKVFNTALTQPQIVTEATALPEPASLGLLAAAAAAGTLGRHRRARGGAGRR